MRYVLIFLGLVTIGLGVVLAAEGEWWIALPDAAFGAGVAFVAYESLQEDRHPSPPPAPTPREGARTK